MILLKDFLEDLTDDIGKIVLSNDEIDNYRDSIVYEGAIHKIPRDLLNSEFSGFEKEDSDSMTIYVSEIGESRNYGSVEEFLENCYSYELTIIDSNSKRILFEGFKYDLSESILKMGFDKLETPTKIHCNIIVPEDYKRDSFRYTDSLFDKLNNYIYKGNVKQFGDIVIRGWETKTKAVSLNKAYSNFLFQAKKKLGLSSTAKLEIDKSKIIKAEEPILKPAKSYSKNYYEDSDYNIPDECNVNVEDTNYNLNKTTRELKWTEEEDRERYKWYGSIHHENYSTCYKASIDPLEFLRLTMRKIDPENIEEGKDYNTDAPFKKLDIPRFVAESTDMFLHVKKKGNSFKVVGHEGRHRMWGLYKMGITKAPIVIYIVDDDYDRYNPGEYHSMRLIGQFNSYSTTLNGLSTFGYKNIK